MGLVAAIQQQWALWKWKQTPLAQALRAHTHQYFYKTPSLARFSEKNKQKIITDFMTKLVALGQSPNGQMELREMLANYVIAYAQYQVLSLTEDEKAEGHYLESPYISGQLHHHIVEASELIEELAQMKWETGTNDPEELVAYCNTRGVILLYYMNGLNMVRIESGDRSPEKDWFKPFVEASLVWEEAHFRQKLGLPELLSDIDALAYSTFMNLVVNGERQPFYEWAKQWPDLYLCGEGPKPRPQAA